MIAYMADDSGDTLMSVVVSFLVAGWLVAGASSFLSSVAATAGKLSARDAAIVAAEHHALPARAVDCVRNAEDEFCSVAVPSVGDAEFVSVVDDLPAGLSVSFVEETPDGVLAVEWSDFYEPSPPGGEGCESPLPPLPVRAVTVRWRPGGVSGGEVPTEGSEQVERLARGPAVFGSAAAWLSWSDDSDIADYVGHEVLEGNGIRRRVSKTTRSGCSVIVLPAPAEIREICDAESVASFQRLEPGFNTPGADTECGT